MRKTSLIILMAIFILGSILRIGYFYLNKYNMETYDDEPWSKLNLALNWIGQSDLNINPTFGPLHTYIIATMHFVSQEHYIILSRLVSLISGILLIILFFYLLAEVFDIRSAYCGAFLLAIYPLHIEMSSVSLAEIPASFLLFSSLYLINKFVKENRITYLILSALALNLSSMLRFEGFIFIALLGAILFWRTRSLRYAFTFIAISSGFLIYWLFFNYRITGDPLSFIKVSARINQITMHDIGLFRRMAGFIQALFHTLSPPVFICSAIGLVICIFKKRLRKNIFLALFPVFLVILILRSIRGDYNSDVLRYSLWLGLLFIPFGAAALGLLCVNRRVGLAVLVPFLALCLFYSTKTLRFYYMQTQLPHSIMEMIAWTKNNVGSGQKVLLEYGIYHPFIMLNSGLNFRRQIIKYDHLKFNKTQYIDEYIDSADYIILHKERGIFREAILNSLWADKLRPVFDNKDWRIIAIEH